jgi:hypothetical protein
MRPGHLRLVLARPTRRTALVGLLAALAACGVDLDLPDDATFDDVLAALHATSAVYRDALSNHGPMAIEAMVELGLTDEIVAFIETYDGTLEARDQATPLSDAERDTARGDMSKLAAWTATYRRDAETMSAEDLLARDWDALAPAWIAAGWHGVLRLAHALRSLGRAESTVRTQEVAHALAFQASWFRELPGRPGERPSRGLLEALRATPDVSNAQRRAAGLILERMEPVDDLEGFEDAVAAVDLGDDVGAAITELSAAAARMFLAAGGTDILLLHAVTGTSALRLLLPWLDPDQARTALGFAFQAVAAAKAATGIGDDWTEDGDETVDAIAELASGASDPHVIKFCEAAVREYSVDPRPEFLAAARAWANGGV